MSGIVRLPDSGNFPELVAAVHDALSNVETVDDARNVVEGLDDARKVLDAMHQYHKVASEFCVLELMAYFKLLDIYRQKSNCQEDPENYWFFGVSQAERRRLEYLNLFDESERQGLIDRCRYDGMSVTSLCSEYNRELREQRKEDERAHDAETIASFKNKALQEFNDYGRVVINTDKILSECFDQSSKYNKELAKGMLESTRDALLNNGAFGRGDGVYSKLANCKDVRDALNVRLASMMHDIMSIVAVCDEWGVGVDDNWFTFKSTNPVVNISDNYQCLLFAVLTFAKQRLIEGRAS